MRILMVISNPFPPEEGIGFYVYNLSKNLIKMGHEVSVLTRGNLKFEKGFYDGINIIKTPFLPLYPFHVHLQGFLLNRKFKELEKNFDLVNIHSPLSPIISTKLPIIATIHTSIVEDAKHLETLNLDTLKWKFTVKISSRGLTQELIDKSKLVTTVSSAVKEELIKYYENVDPLVIGNGVNENIFSPIEFNERDPYVLYVSRLDYRKGILDLIEIVKLLKKEDIKILIAGDGPLKKHFHNEITKNNLNNVELLGHVSGNELVSLYQNASIFLFPTLYEGLPTVLLEAMSCALPVVTTDIPAHKDLVTNMQNGILIKTGQVEQMAGKILELKNEPDISYELGKRARETIESKFTWNIISKKMEEVYINAIK